MSIYSEIKPEVRMFADMCVENSRIDPELYLKYDVKRGLRDLNGKGVLTGLTNISEIISSKTVDGKSVPCEGELYYRGYSVEELVRRQLAGDHFGYERTAYLLLFGELPDEEHFKTFCELLSFYRTLPTSFVRDIIMKAPSSEMTVRPAAPIEKPLVTALTVLPAESSSSAVRMVSSPRPPISARPRALSTIGP